MIPPGCVLRPCGISLPSAEDSDASWEPCDGEELQEDLSFPRRCQSGKGGRVASPGLQGVRRLNPEPSSRTLGVRIGVFPLLFVIDKHQGKLSSFTFFILIYIKDSIL